VARNEQRVAAYKSDGTPETVNRDQFLRVVDGMVFGDNPREGFFNGTTFNHPDLKFKFVFPQGWKFQNQPQAVVGVSPQQDAIIQLSFAKGSPQEALQAFLGKEGISAGRTSANPVNGFPAAHGEFQAQTQQGTLTGLATYIQYDGRTYQILGYTSSQKYQSYVNTFFGAAQSFNRLTDEAALNVQPKRLRLIKLDRDITIDAFYRANQSPLPFEYIAIINGVEPGALLKAGSLVKTVR
jgi:predicted Zn-dependent protease